jgi:hypothetical protein
MTMIAAAPDLAELVRSTHPVGPESMGAFAMVLVAIVSVVLMVVVWAVFIRKPSRGRRRERGRLTSEAPAKPRDDAQGQRRHRRRRSKDHRNPTLAETGGLPPLRDGGGVGKGEEPPP